MPTNTYVALDKVTVATATPSITFSSIPQTYTDLVLVFNARSDRNDQANRPTDLIKVTYNGSNASNYSDTVLGSNSTSTPFSYRETNQAFMAVGAIPGAQSNAGEFGVNTFHIMSYSNTTTYKTLLARGGNATSVGSGNYYMGAMVGLWRGATGSSTEAITSITLAPYVGPNFVAGSTFSLYGIKAWAAETTPKATGGYVYEDSTYYYHSFPFSGTFTPNQSLSCDILQIAGGGGGGYRGGGGGAGGLLAFTSQSLTATNYAVTVGAGGTKGTIEYSNNGTNGGNSQFASLTASVGGGYGGAYQTNGNSGGSGGGGGATTNGTVFTGGSGTSGQGNAGASGSGTVNNTGGGGGGAGAAGTTPNGGNGVSTYSSWGVVTNTGQNVSGTVWYAGGGGAAEVTNGTPGTGGLGGGASAILDLDGVDGMVSTGGGGSGGCYPATNGGGNGGSGIVIVRYAK